MGQVLHGCATTTETVRLAIQNSQESLRALAKRYGINQKTVAKWKERETVADLPTGPREAKSTVLSIEEEAIIEAASLRRKSSRLIRSAISTSTSLSSRPLKASSTSMSPPLILASSPHARRGALW